jgi:iron complex outermembrane receptor protein
VGGNGYDVETVTDAEFGFKLSGSGLTRFTFNGAAYQNWIQDAQRVAYTLVGGSPAAITVNVPKAKVKGFEFDGTVEPSDWLSLGASLSYTDAKFTDNKVSVAGGAPVAFGTYPDAPKWSGSVFGVLTAPVGEDMEASLRADLYKQTSTSFSSTGNLNQGTVLPSYEVANLRLALKHLSAGWTVAALVKNVFDKTYYVGGVALGDLDGRSWSIAAPDLQVVSPAASPLLLPHLPGSTFTCTLDLLHNVLTPRSLCRLIDDLHDREVPYTFRCARASKERHL